MEQQTAEKSVSMEPRKQPYNLTTQHK